MILYSSELLMKCEVPGRSDFTLLLISNPAGSVLESPTYDLARVWIILCLLTSEDRIRMSDETKSFSASTLLQHCSDHLYTLKQKHDFLPCQYIGVLFLCIPLAEKTVSTSIPSLNVWATLCLAFLQFLWFFFEPALLKGQLHSQFGVHMPTEEVQSKSSSFLLLGCLTGG